MGVLQLTERDLAVARATAIAVERTEDLSFLMALVARSAPPGVFVPNSGELIAAALGRAFVASAGWEDILLPSGHSIRSWPPRGPEYIFAAIERAMTAVTEPPNFPLMRVGPLLDFLRLMTPEWRHDGSDDDSSLVTPAGEFCDSWRPAVDAFCMASPLRPVARAAGEECFAGLSAEHKEFVDTLAQFVPTAFRRVIQKGGGWV